MEISWKNYFLEFQEMGSQDSSIRFRKTYLLGLGENLITRIGETLVANYTTYTFTQIGDTLVSNCTTDSACETENGHARCQQINHDLVL